MDKKPLIVKCLAIGIILLFVGTCIIPAIANPLPLPSNTVSHPRIGLQSHINITWNENDTSELIAPLNELRVIPLNITYWLSQGIFGRFLLFLMNGRVVSVDLKISEKPSWCTAVLSQSSMTFIISDAPQTNENMLLSVLLDKTAPFTPFQILIEASVHPLKGPLGIMKLVQQVSYSRALELRVGYYLAISVNPDSDIINATPGNTSILAINITNLGNVRTIVHADIVDSPTDGWNITITEQIVLDINMTNIAYLVVRPPSNFSGTESITITYTPRAADNPTQYGEPVSITIVVICEP
jgi:hypothetical protein